MSCGICSIRPSHYDDGPIAVRYPREAGLGVPYDKTPVKIPIGSWETVTNGDSAAILAMGPMVTVAQEAAELLKREGLSVRVVNARFVKPLDHGMLMQLAQERIPLLVLEEGAQAGGLGGAVLEFYAANGVHDIQGDAQAFRTSSSSMRRSRNNGKIAALTAEQVAAKLRAAAVRTRQQAT